MSAGADRLARRLLEQARGLEVPTLPDAEAAPPAPLEFARAVTFFELDPWQAAVLTSNARKRLLCCSRQSGKSTVTALAACYEALYSPGSLVLLLMPSLRQSGELHRTCMQFLRRVDDSVSATVQESALRVELANGSRIIALPGSESTTRGYSAATLVIIDEAARVPDDLIAAVRPALATTNGRLIALSTPAGRRGWFHANWSKGADWDWECTTVTAEQCPRISAEFLADERRELGEFVYSQEYNCEFLDAETTVFSSAMIERALTPDIAPLWGEA